MSIPEYFKDKGCERCTGGYGLEFDFTMAFQPIVDFETQSIFAYEALVRGLNGESALSILEKVNAENMYRFDQACRVKAIELAAKLQMPTFLSINFLPNAVYQPERCIQTSLEAAKFYGFPTNKIIFEVTEVEKIHNVQKIRSIVEYYKQLHFQTAIDDFGSGYSNLDLLADFRTNFVKLDMHLVREIDSNRPKNIIVRGIVDVCRQLEVEVIAEGVEKLSELSCLRDLGIRYYQGYYFARPSLESLPEVPPEKFQLAAACPNVR